MPYSMDNSIQRALGILGDQKRVFRFIEGEVTREEFEHSRLIDQVVFGPKGYVETIGPTWNMIHDPRFIEIEGKFVVTRRSVLGGDATLGRQYIDSDGNFTSSIVDLEQYSEILGEGRNFYCFLVHPDEDCFERRWLERVWNNSTIPAGPDVKCTCKGVSRDPFIWKDETDENIWNEIKAHWPNYFRQGGLKATTEQLLADETDDPKTSYKFANRDAHRLFKLVRADLVGLVASYCRTAKADDWVVVDAEDAATTAQVQLAEETPTVSMEVDFLEKALSFRASLRSTAAKILDQIGFSKNLKNLEKSMGEEATRLTDAECDTLLRMVYQSDYPNDKVELVANLTNFVINAFQVPFAERQNKQLTNAISEAEKTMEGLQDGSIKTINQRSDAEPEDTRTVEKRYEDYCAKMQEYGETADSYDIWLAGYNEILIQNAIFKNPLKKDLFLIHTQAEADATKDEKAVAVLGILEPVFASAEYFVGEDEYLALLNKIKATGYFKMEQQAFSEEFHSKESPERGWEQQLDPKTLETLPQDGRSLDEVWADSLSKLSKGNA